MPSDKSRVQPLMRAMVRLTADTQILNQEYVHTLELYIIAVSRDDHVTAGQYEAAFRKVCDKILANATERGRLSKECSEAMQVLESSTDDDTENTNVGSLFEMFSNLTKKDMN